MDDSSRGTGRRADAVLVLIDGSTGDAPVLQWAAEEAGQTGRRLVIAHAAGHLSPHLTFAERHVAVQRRKEAGNRVVDRAVHAALAVCPELQVDTVVRLLDPATLLPIVGGQPHLTVQSGAVWCGLRERGARAPVLAVAGDADRDAHVLDEAVEYAERRGLAVTLLEGHRGEPLADRIQVASPASSLVFMARPEQRRGLGQLDWPGVMTTSMRSRSPVVLVGAASRARAGARAG